jgi:hypothetical protein
VDLDDYDFNGYVLELQARSFASSCDDAIRAWAALELGA